MDLLLFRFLFRCWIRSLMCISHLIFQGDFKVFIHLFQISQNGNIFNNKIILLIGRGVYSFYLEWGWSLGVINFAAVNILSWPFMHLILNLSRSVKIHDLDLQHMFLWEKTKYDYQVCCCVALRFLFSCNTLMLRVFGLRLIQYVSHDDQLCSRGYE